MIVITTIITWREVTTGGFPIWNWLTSCFIPQPYIFSHCLVFLELCDQFKLWLASSILWYYNCSADAVLRSLLGNRRYGMKSSVSCTQISLCHKTSFECHLGVHKYPKDNRYNADITESYRYYSIKWRGCTCWDEMTSSVNVPFPMRFGKCILSPSWWLLICRHVSNAQMSLATYTNKAVCTRVLL